MFVHGSAALMRTAPEQQGIASSAILKFIDAIEQSGQEVHSLMLLRHGCVVAEGWWVPYRRDTPHMMFSLSKSFASTAVGMAVTEGFFSVDDPVISFFPNDLPESIGEWLADMRVRHLLTMSTGHDVRPFPFMYGHPEGNWVKGFFEVPLKYPPGTHFFYNTGASYMLSEIVQRTTGMNLMGFLSPRLFEPLGIDGAAWQESPSGVNLGGIGLSIKTEDIARFGQLYLQKGLWNGKRILSESWIEEATSAQVSNGANPKSDWNQGYGYQFWRCQHGIYRGDGSFGQFCFVMDEYDAVLAMTGAVRDMQQTMNLVWDHLLPAMQPETLAEDQIAYRRLVERLTELKYDPVQGSTTSPLAQEISGSGYIAQSNSFGIESLTFDFTDDRASLKLRLSPGDELLTATYGAWFEGQVDLFNEIWLDGRLPYVASGAWTDENRYIMVVRLYETPYVYTLTYHFHDDEVTINVQINVSLESTAPQVITATRIS